MLTKAHFSWQGLASNIEGFEGEIHGKNDLINNFCIAVPTNEARCSQCHAGYGYDDNTFSFSDPKTIDCLVCHDQTGTYAKGKTTGGMPYHSTDEGVMKSCVDCHGDSANIHVGSSIETIVANHPTLACQVCHIPTFARDTSTKVEWYWEDAGQDIDPIPVDPETGRPTYDKKKGRFVWKNNVTASLRYFDGKWSRFIIGANDQYTSTPVVLGAPVADYTTPGAMIYPFKKMIGNQVADANNNTMLVPHLFGTKGGPNP